MQSRRRKLPPGMVQQPDPENPSHEKISESQDDTYTQDRETNATFGKWFPMPNNPVRFARLPNGTISSLQFGKDEAKNEKINGIKKSIIFAFQTSFPNGFNPNEEIPSQQVAEHDELGYHMSNYKYELENGNIRVKKEVGLDDLIEIQRDSTNGGMLDVKTRELQVFSNQNKDLRQFSSNTSVEMATTTHPTQVYQVNEDLKATVAVEVKKNITLLARFPSTSSQIVNLVRQFADVEWASSEKPSEVLDIVDDPLDHVADVFAKLEPGLYAKGIETILDEFTENPNDQSKIAPLIRGLQLESDLYINGRIKTRTIYDMVVPVVRRQLVKCERMQSWSLCLTFVNLAVAATGKFADRSLLAFIQNDALPNIYRVRLLNMVIFMDHPSDHLVRQLVNIHETNDKYDDDEELEFNNHLLLAIGATASRKTTNSQTKEIAGEYLNKIITEKFSNDTCKTNSPGLLSLSAAGNFLNPRVVNEVTESGMKLVNTLISVANKCRRNSDISASALGSISKLHSIPEAMQSILNFITQSDCTQKALLAGHLMKVMQYDLKVWPARGVNDIDRVLAALVMYQPQTLSCSPDTFSEYFERKRIPVNSAAWTRHFGDLVVTTPMPRRSRLPNGFDNETLARNKRQVSGNGYSYGVYVSDWDDYDGKFSIIQTPSQFQTDKSEYPTNKHILYDLTGGTNLVAVYMRAGFFTGKDSSKYTSKLFGRLVVNLELGLVINVLDLAFIREQTEAGFYGYTRLSAIGFTYLDLPQYACNITIDQWSYAYYFTLPVYTISFGGFGLNLNADFEARITLYLYPSYCLYGNQGIQFKPTGAISGNAFAEIANSFFGVGINIRLFVDYYLELSLEAPEGCLKLYHGNDDMTFDLNIYLKLPNFEFTNVSVS